MICYVKILFTGTGSNIFFRAEALKKINGFDESYLRHQDVETLVRFFKNQNNKMLGIEDILVVKIGDDSMNPNIDKSIFFKEKFLNDFEEEINKYENRKYIYYTNYSNLIFLAIQAKAYNKIKSIKEKLKDYCEFDIKLFMKCCIYFINNYIPLKYFKHNIYNKRAQNKDIVKNIQKEMQLIENFYTK